MDKIERIKRELVYKGAIIDVYKDYVKIPNGNTAKWDFIGHKGAAAVVPVLENGNILMVKLISLLSVLLKLPVTTSRNRSLKRYSYLQQSLL